MIGSSDRGQFDSSNGKWSLMVAGSSVVLRAFEPTLTAAAGKYRDGQPTAPQPTRLPVEGQTFVFLNELADATGVLLLAVRAGGEGVTSRT